MRKILLTFGLVMSVAASRADIFDINLNATNDPNGILSGVFEASPNSSTATGGEVGTGIFYDNATAGLTINVAYGLFGFQPLTAAFTATHLHQAPVGVSGPVIINLDAGATDIHTAFGSTSGFFSGTVNLTPAQEAALFANDIYMNIHSTAFGGGEIRAQFVPATVPEPATSAFVAFGLATVVLFRRRRA
jgi:uncharacterized protein (TIGR03382 family)